ncbi:MAG: dihydroorotase [Candidatus Delongbacteria bacterium]|nr:dihydroorotase [Candidatus Delongbacteria bacterium]
MTNDKFNITELPPKLLIKGGKVIDTYSEKEYISDILIEKGAIKQISQSIKPLKDHTVIDASGMYISAGFFDMHVHLREPGNEKAENYITGTKAAVAGGVTSLAAMPNTFPCVDNTELFKSLKRKSDSLPVNIYQIPAVTLKREGKTLVDMGSLSAAGAVAFSDDGSGIRSSETMRKALSEAGEFNSLILVHAEDHTFTPGAMNESDISEELGISSSPNIAESLNIARDIEIARYIKGSVHFQHVSAKESVDLVRRAKKDNLNVTCEVTPHHYSLTDERVRTLSTDFKMNPPLRSKTDLKAVIKGLKDGTIDVIATDHAPHLKEKKDLDFEQAPFGVIGLETLLSSGITYLVRKRKLSLMEFLKKITVNPRKILKIEADLIRNGMNAELVIFDKDCKWKVDRKKFMSLSENTCFDGETHFGKVRYTINKGMIFCS